MVCVCVGMYLLYHGVYSVHLWVCLSSGLCRCLNKCLDVSQFLPRLDELKWRVMGREVA